tara:strand:+ start:314 stop:592 length:279 start_codon:yes stop_codon:yes gene_type:complete
MSYKLADGSLSTDYKIGDEFTHKCGHDIFVFIEDDGTRCPWFKSEETHRNARHWSSLTPVKATKKANKKTKAIKRLRKKIKQWKAIIKELEQ